MQRVNWKFDQGGHPVFRTAPARRTIELVEDSVTLGLAVPSMAVLAQASLNRDACFLTTSLKSQQDKVILFYSQSYSPFVCNWH
jgi:hypothetical protein